jgi:predicted alpha/beta-fold hydrolase
MLFNSLIPLELPTWAPDRHTQTILGDLLPSKMMPVKGERILIDCNDGDQILGRIFRGPSDFVICMFHGLTGSSEAGYMQRIAKLFIKQGHSVCLMNHRNCGEGFGLARKPYHAGCSEDIARVTHELRTFFPQKNIAVLGFSMSGNASLLLASGVIPTQNIFSLDHFKEKREQLNLALPDFILSINPPVNLKNSQKAFRKSINPLYEWNFIRHLKNLGRQLDDTEIFESMGASYRMTLKDFDDAYTSKRNGFKDAADYYEKCSASNYLKEAVVPTMILTSKDDPFISYKDLESAEKSNKVNWHLENFGGHMGYLHKEKLPHGSFRWMDYAVSELFDLLIT